MIQHWPEFVLITPARRDFYLFSVHASVTCGQFVGWVAFAGWGIGVQW